VKDNAGQGNYRAGFDQRLLKHPLLNRADEYELACRMRSGDQAAADELLRCNIKLIANTAHRFANRARHLNFGDLMMIGIAAFIENLPKFEPETGNRLSTYMSWWIQHAINRGIADLDRTVRIPVHIRDKVRKFVKDGTESPNVRLLHTLASARDISLDAPLADSRPELGGTLSELFDPASTIEQTLAVPSVEEQVERSESIRVVSAELNRLPRHLRAVLRCRFWQGLTLEQTAAEAARLDLIGTTKKGGGRKPVSRERIRQIEAQALEQLRRRLKQRLGPA
jgi:RNA polymerase primary sigma factor